MNACIDPKWSIPLTLTALIGVINVGALIAQAIDDWRVRRAPEE